MSSTLFPVNGSLKVDSSQLKPVPKDVSIRHHDSFMHIERQSKQLQQDLQTLLDAQSAGLSAGLSDPAQDGTPSNGSSTPTATASNSPHPPIIVPVRQPRKKKIGLREARRGILRSMHQLLSLKEEGRNIIDSEMSDRRAAMRQISNFMEKRSNLENAVLEIQSDPEKLKAENLSREANSLGLEIQELETKLLEMKSRHRYLVSEASQVQNSVDSRLSSYKESLSLLDSNVSGYLSSPPIQPLASSSATSSAFYSLHPERRTLEITGEQWRSEITELRKKQRETDGEITALKEGGGVWYRVVAAVTNFEKLLQKEMHRMTLIEPHPRSSSSQSNTHEDNSEELLKAMETTMAELEENLSIAEEKHWNLLICCIGAELEAFREAKALLAETFPGMKEDGATGVGVPTEFATESQEDLLSQSPSTNAPTQLDSEQTHERAPSRSEDEEDDEPDPAWLIS